MTHFFPLLFFQLKLLDVIQTLVDPTQNAWKDTVASLNVLVCPDLDPDLFLVQVVNPMLFNFAYQDHVD